MLFCPISMYFRAFHVSNTLISINRSILTSSTCLQKSPLVQPMISYRYLNQNLLWSNDTTLIVAVYGVLFQPFPAIDNIDTLLLWLSIDADALQGVDGFVFIVWQNS